MDNIFSFYNPLERRPLFSLESITSVSDKKKIAIWTKVKVKLTLWLIKHHGIKTDGGVEV
jgi:hypothetical protein